MADGGDKLSREEVILQRHRKERKDLQQQISKLRHSISKGDKKQKKEVTAQVAILEAQLTEKQDRELEELKDEQTEEKAPAAAEEEENGVEELSEDLAKATVMEEMGFKVIPTRKKPSKAQKRREKKAAQANEREQEIAQAEEDNKKGVRHVEAQALKAKLTARGLIDYAIPSDGNCLYAAVVDQLKRQHLPSSVSSLRGLTAGYMRAHMDDFLPFLSKHDTGEPYTADEFEDYCKKLESTPEWGGHLEIQALSSVLSAQIEVIQAEGPSILSGEQFTSPPLLLSYHRHMYGLGEHYNSVIPKPDEEEEDGFS